MAQNNKTSAQKGEARPKPKYMPSTTIVVLERTGAMHEVVGRVTFKKLKELKIAR